ncbi:MAG TPA: nitroreductase family protein [Thermomicrobiales bacterium]|nr:nitroreductase family protein [Thermomicrobiales bacterium]
MDLHEALYTTRAMRRLKPDPIPLDVQARILDAAIRAPHVGEAWRFILVDDAGLRLTLGTLYEQAFLGFLANMGVPDVEMAMQGDGPMAQALRSGVHLARNFHTVPLLLIGYAQTDGSGIYPALWSAMLAARAEGVGSTLTGMLHSFHASEVNDLLGVPSGEGWNMHGVVAMGYPRGRWGLARRKPVDAVAARNGWTGELGLTVPEPLWQEPAGTEPG